MRCPVSSTDTATEYDSVGATMHFTTEPLATNVTSGQYPILLDACVLTVAVPNAEQYATASAEHDPLPALADMYCETTFATMDAVVDEDIVYVATADVTDVTRHELDLVAPFTLSKFAIRQILCWGYDCFSPTTTDRDKRATGRVQLYVSDCRGWGSPAGYRKSRITRRTNCVV